jgi:ATP-citrate lyase beta-subunit
MTRDKPKGKALLIGGAIANFTDVANTFKGSHGPGGVPAEAADSGVKIYVRRGGPNYELLKAHAPAGRELKISIGVYGPETT